MLLRPCPSICAILPCPSIFATTGMTPRLKTVPNVPFGFPEYGMTNASNFGGGFPLPVTPKGCEKGAFIYGNDTDA